MDGSAYFNSTYSDDEEDSPEARSLLLEADNDKLRAELAELRRELAAKTVQLSKRDAAEKAVHDRAAEARAAELAAAATAPKEQVIRSLEASVNQLEVALAQRTEELEEARRLFAGQKRALKDALAAAAEREAAEAAADEAGRSAATAAAEEELERLAQELTQLRTRSALELRAREAEVAALKQQLAAHEADKHAAVAAAEAAAAAAQDDALAAAEAAHRGQLAELQQEVSRLRAQAQSHAREEHDELRLASSLASVDTERAQLQREFESFKELTAQTHRQHREEQSRLMEEVASLKARIAAEAARVAMGGSPLPHGLPPAGPAPGGGAARLLGAARRLLGGGGGSVRGKTFSALPEDGGVAGLVEQWVAQLERQRRGLVPLLVVAALVLLVLLVAVVRAAASARGEHKGPLCFLSKLGIQIGDGCGSSLAAAAQRRSSAVADALGQLVEATPRVKDWPGSSDGGGGGSVLDNAAAAAGAAGGAAGDRRLLLWRLLSQGHRSSGSGGWPL